MNTCATCKHQYRRPSFPTYLCRKLNVELLSKLQDTWTCIEYDLIEPWVEKKTVTLKRWLVKVNEEYVLTTFWEEPPRENSNLIIIREYDSMEVEI